MTLRAQRGTPRHPLPRTSPRPRTARACPHRTRWPSPRSAAPHGSRGGRKAPGQPRRPPPSTNGSVWPLLRWARSEERRVGEEGRSRWSPYFLKKKNQLLAGFPFIQEPPSGDLPDRVLIRHHDYNQCFPFVQLLPWTSQVKFNVTASRNLPTHRAS